jgi:peptidylprolyl isomerase
MLSRLALASALTLCLTGCTLKDDQPASNRPDIPAPPDVAAVPADAHRTPSGLASKIIQIGMSNVRPSIGSRVRAHYTGWTTDGKMFDSSVNRGEPLTFTVRKGEVIDGWVEGIQLMVVGEKRRFWIPESLAYEGKQEPYGLLVFDVELLSVN